MARADWAREFYLNARYGADFYSRAGAETRAALDDAGVIYTLEKVTDYGDIAAYGILSTPGLVLNEKVVSAGRIPKRDQIVNWAHAAETAP